MQFIKVINPKYHYSSHLKRFTSILFRNSSNDGGISAIDRKCILQSERSICEHIEKYYSEKTSIKPIFWEFSSHTLCSKHKVTNYKISSEEPSTTGDHCHVNIIGIPKRKAENISKSVQISEVKICTGDFAEQATEDILEKISLEDL